MTSAFNIKNLDLFHQARIDRKLFATHQAFLDTVFHDLLEHVNRGRALVTETHIGNDLADYHGFPKCQ